MKNVSIIGVGLIGGSLGLALRNSKSFPCAITGIGRNAKKLKLAKKCGAVDEFTTDYGAGVKNADIVVICLPVDLIALTVKNILPFVKPGAIITDAGSVKGSIEREVKKVFSLSPIPFSLKPVFIGAHPMAGTEKTGVANALKDLYKNAGVIITANSSNKAAKIVAKMWSSAGAKIIFMNAKLHDKIVASTSHLPHVFAFLLSQKAGKLWQNNKSVEKIIAGSFKDATRVANSNPADWSTIISANKNELGNSINDLIKRLKEVKKHLCNKQRLESIFCQAKIARQNILNIKE